MAGPYYGVLTFPESSGMFFKEQTVHFIPPCPPSSHFQHFPPNPKLGHEVGPICSPTRHFVVASSNHSLLSEIFFPHPASNQRVLIPTGAGGSAF